MALIVEDGTGLSTAEAYVSVVDADAYFAKFGGASDTWVALSESGKEVHLRKATRFVDAEFGSASLGKSWRGCRGTAAQALDFPRAGLVDDDGFALDSSGAASIPQKLKDTVAILADKSASADLLPDLTSPSTIKSKSVKVGSIAVKTEYEQAAEPLAMYTLAERLLSGLLRSSYDMVRG